MLELRIINSDFTVNDFDEIGEKEFVTGEATTLAFRLYNTLALLHDYNDSNISLK